MQQIEIGEISGVLPGLLQQIESGGEVVLLREGRPVARIVPEPGSEVGESELSPERQAKAREAIARIRAMSERLNLGPFDMEQFKRDRDEGRL